MKELTETEACYKAEAYCSMAEHCLSEVVDKLESWGVEADARERILKQLVKERYIDEVRYCRFFIRDKYRFNKWGRIKIAQALRQKGISRQVSDSMWECIDEDEYREILQQLLDAKRKSVKARNAYELNGKLIRFAMSRGYEMDEIRRCLPNDDTDEWLDE